MKKKHGSKNSSMFGQDRKDVKREILEKVEVLFKTYSVQCHAKKWKQAQGGLVSLAFCIQKDI